MKQLLRLSLNSYKASYKDEKGSTKTVTVKFESSQSKDSPLTAHWVSVTDGTKIVDFVI